MIEEFLRELDGHLHVSRRARARILEEVRDHLDDAMVAAQSEEQAVRAFGSAPALARQFNAQAATTAMRRTPFVVGACALFVMGGFVLAAVTQPQASLAAPADMVVQISFFAALLGLQVAAVAGARALGRVAVRWKAADTSADRTLVHRAGVICAVGLAVAAAGWTIAVIERTHARPITAVAGCVLMLAAAAIAVAGLRRPITVEDDATRGSTAMIRRRPVAVCSAVALLAALSSMVHAETTFVVALGWGAAEAAAVVAGFVFLGPRLELR